MYKRQRAEGPGVETRVTVGFVQIYNEEVYDLLVDESERPGGTTTPLRLVDRAGATRCEGASARAAESAEDVTALLATAMRRREVANQRLNASSSRSHAIVTLYVRRETFSPGAGSRVAASKLSFADLAGSEPVSYTHLTLPTKA